MVMQRMLQRVGCGASVRSLRGIGPTHGMHSATRTGRTATGGGTTQRSATSTAIFFAIPVAATFSLGLWQTRRLEWKRDLIAARTASLAETPLDETALDADVEVEHRRVSVSGTLLHGKEMLVGPRGAPEALPGGALQWGGSSGYLVVTPMKTDGGRCTLVVRGWIPQRLVQRERRKGAKVRPTAMLHSVGALTEYEDAESGTHVSFTGVLRAQDEKNRFMPTNDASKDSWFYVDIEAMLEAQGLDRGETHAFIELVEPLPVSGWPFPRRTDDFLRFRTPPSAHITYAATWFILCGFLTVLSSGRVRQINRRM